MTRVATPSQSSEFGSSQTRASLISRVRQQDVNAWRELVELYGPLIAHWCYRLELDSHASADCVQEVFSSLYRALPNYAAQKSHGSFRSWLWTITRNKVRDHLRRQRQQAAPAGGSWALLHLLKLPAPPEVAEEEPSSIDELQSLVSRAMEQIRSEFEPRTMQIFVRNVIDQVATDIVAEEFAIKPAGVRQIRSRVLRRLRQQLGDVDF